MYLSFDDAENDEHFPLVYCVAFAFPALDAIQIDHHVEGLFELGGAGGDPWWKISRFVNDAGQIMYSAEYETYIDGVAPPYGEYDEATVKRYFARVMREYVRVHPESKTHIGQLIQKYQLEPKPTGI
ncbi:hypothetical protein [Rhodoferax mekongensis]|uniref:CDI immunity protein domain-containing protein n=1 Tax=Rhodoferax mekongensis TaxID=3068341 RepID=A0ABZ0AY53_9BURK|nr:hypothetical protein [Rhodoferax sp. TBRC 17307]WNO04235.1 hypothetical protein RAN89_15185 [Rhodoferax sp. TBRC 17307]